MQVLKKIFFSYVLVILAFPIDNCFAQLSSTREYQIKAAFIYNFTQFVEWPATALPANQEPMIIGVLGENPFGNYLEKMVSGEKVNGRPIAVKYCKDLDEVKVCHILFVNSKTIQADQVLRELKGKQILTVGDSGDFMKHGGMICFYTRDNKIQFQINPEAAKESNITISSKLLKLAQIYKN